MGWKEPLASSNGVQQGDPLGPALFSNGISDLVSRIQSPFNIWYLGDATIGGALDSVAVDIKKVQDFEGEGGLTLNTRKCELLVIGGSLQERRDAVQVISNVLPDVKQVNLEDMELLGAPVGERSIPRVLTDKRDTLDRLRAPLSMMHPQAALCLWRYSLGSPRFGYTLRTSPAERYPAELEAYDRTAREVLSEVLNIDLQGDSWSRASLPIREGGLGIRAATELAPLCYAASLNQFGPLAASLLSENAKQEVERAKDESEYRIRIRLDPGPLNEHFDQQMLDGMRSKKLAREILDATESSREKAAVLAARDSFSGGWLKALPSPQLGTMLDPNTFRIAAALRIGSPVCEPFTCVACGEAVGSDGLHPLSCTKSPGRVSRHAEINAIIKRALRKAGVPSTLEPRGLGMADDRRPDGVTIPLWSKGKCLAWDATVSCTVAPSYVQHSSSHPGWVAEHADAGKRRKYAELSNRYHFVAIALETLGPISKGAERFIVEVANRLEAISGDRREGMFLRQMLSLAVCRGNVASIVGAMG